MTFTAENYDNERLPGAYEDGCLSRDPYCSRNPRSPLGTYEAYTGAICGDCEEAQHEDERARNTVPAGRR